MVDLQPLRAENLRENARARAVDWLGWQDGQDVDQARPAAAGAVLEVAELGQVALPGSILQ